MAKKQYLDYTGLQEYRTLEKAEVTKVETKVGDVTQLQTTAKTDLVSALNEVRNSVSAGGTDAAITIDTGSTTEGYLKSYTIKQGSNTVGTIDIPKDLVVASGSVVVDPAGQDAGTYIKLVIANQTEPLYVNVGTMVDIYTAKASATQVQLTVDNSTREISAVIVSGGVGATELAENAVTTVKIADANVTLSKLASDVTDAITAAETNAKTYADTLDAAMDARVDDLETKVGDGFEAITKAEIDALFA